MCLKISPLLVWYIFIPPTITTQKNTILFYFLLCVCFGIIIQKFTIIFKRNHRTTTTIKISSSCYNFFYISMDELNVSLYCCCCAHLYLLYSCADFSPSLPFFFVHTFYHGVVRIGPGEILKWCFENFFVYMCVESMSGLNCLLSYKRHHAFKIL